MCMNTSTLYRVMSEVKAGVSPPKLGGVAAAKPQTGWFSGISKNLLRTTPSARKELEISLCAQPPL